MKIILTHEVDGLGVAGDVAEVKDGYARNFLFRRGLATAWTKGGQKQVDAIKTARANRAVKSLADAQALKGTLEAATIHLHVRAGESGRLYGAVTTAEIADAIKESGAGTIDRRTVQVPTPIRSAGQHQVLVRLHPEVLATVKVDVVGGK